MIEVSGASDIGCVRTSNEDSFGVFDGVYVVADGLGGHAAGEVASRRVVAAVEELSRRGAGDAAALVAAVQEANARVHRAAEENPAYEGMGSTATVLRIDEGTGMAYYAHVGDSRLYLLRSGILRQVSRDHSYVEELVAQGKISEDEAQHHPRKNLLMRAVGVDAQIAVDGDGFPLAAGDRFLLATDGLTNMVEDEELREILGGDIVDAAERMVRRAVAAGGRDNITAIALSYEPS